MADGTIELRGAFLPVTTPFDATTGDVDVPAFCSHLSRWFENPVSGILISGSTDAIAYFAARHIARKDDV
ncbi:MAG: hypothetical protein OXU33_00170, partial [Gemmatimonadota bacterium]|nr:hypothetical protein [Gemmatimonadota bacterium]